MKRNQTKKISDMEKVRIIEDGDLYHVYVGGGCDFWMSKQELLELYAALLPIVKKGGEG